MGRLQHFVPDGRLDGLVRATNHPCRFSVIGRSFVVSRLWLSLVALSLCHVSGSHRCFLLEV
jgi:hypothetical protein